MRCALLGFVPYSRFVANVMLFVFDLFFKENTCEYVRMYRANVVEMLFNMLYTIIVSVQRPKD